MANTDRKRVGRKKRILRIRKKISGTSERPRLRVFKSNRHIYAQLIDDVAGHTIFAESSMSKDIDSTEMKNKTQMAKRVGELVAAKAKNYGIETVVFDRGGYIYHGRVKALSEAAREGGLLF